MVLRVGHSRNAHAHEVRSKQNFFAKNFRHYVLKLAHNNIIVCFVFTDSNVSTHDDKQYPKYKYYIFGHYPSSCLYLKTVLFIFKTTFRTLDSVFVFW
jgi:hypothetical protein